MSGPISRLMIIAAMSALLLACSNNDDGKSPSADLEALIARSPVGSDPDYWIEMENMAGEWERTGLVFGYYGDGEECQKAIQGLKAANSAREYRCMQANVRTNP